MTITGDQEQLNLQAIALDNNAFAFELYSELRKETGNL